jgi:aromatic ring-opening dioxygenase catalytic subunit (LigB family)
MAHPTEEHFLPLLVAAGAASTKGRAASFPIVGFEYGSLSRRCVQFG